MRKIIFSMLMITGLCAAVFAQESIAGAFRNDKEGTTFVFSADGTVAMIGDPETVQKAMAEERNRGGAGDGELSDRLIGTWTVKGKSVEILFREDGKDNRMKLTIVNNDTLRLSYIVFSADYKRVR